MLWEKAKSDKERALFKIIYKLFANTEFDYNGITKSSNMGVFQGSVLAPILFKFYLHEALISEERLKTQIKLNTLWAFADDLIIGFYSSEELEIIIQSVRKLGFKFNL